MEAERTSEPNGYTKTIKSLVSVVVNPSFCDPASTIWALRRMLGFYAEGVQPVAELLMRIGNNASTFAP
jgi:hypothetical protein